MNVRWVGGIRFQAFRQAFNERSETWFIKSQ